MTMQCSWAAGTAYGHQCREPSVRSVQGKPYCERDAVLREGLIAIFIRDHPSTLREWPEDDPDWNDQYKQEPVAVAGWDVDDDDHIATRRGYRTGGLGSGDWIEDNMERDRQRDMETE